jgi:hypothetical protein
MTAPRSPRRHQRREPLTLAVRAYLETGDYRAHRNLDVFVLAGRVMRDAPEALEELRSLWDAHRDEILASWPGPERPWAERTLGENT